VITDMLQIQLPIFLLLGASSLFAGGCFFRLRKQKAFVGAGMLSLGFFLWGFYLATYPLAQQYGNLSSAGFFVGAVLQLFIAVSMIVLVLEEVRDTMVQKERLHAIGQMAVGTAHDVNNALCPITGYTELLLATQPNLTKESRADLQKVTQAAENVAQIVDRMRDYYRSALDPNPLSVENIARPIEPQPAPAAVPPPCNTYEPCRPLRILFIDDEPLVRQLMHNVLELHDHKVTVAASGREGLELFRSNLRGSEPYEVVITDLGMPEMDGRQVARALRAESPQTPIVMLTGWGRMMQADGETVPEVDALLGKPPRMEELNNLLFQVTAKHN